MVIDGETVNCSVAVGNAVGNSRVEGQVRLQGWYSNWGGSQFAPKAWKYVARFNDRAKANTFATNVIKACHNDYIRYNTEYRDQLYNAILNGATIDDIVSVKYCDCSSFICALLLTANISVGLTNTNGLINEIVRSGQFTVYDDVFYCNQSSGLQVGDIVWREHFIDDGGEDHNGHAMAVVGSVYDAGSAYYENVQTSDRAQNMGRYMPADADDAVKYVSNGPYRSTSSAPVDLSEFTDLGLFMLGAYITGGEAVTFTLSRSSKMVKIIPSVQ